MEKNTNASGSGKDSFKNTPHVSGATGTTGGAVSSSAATGAGTTKSANSGVGSNINTNFGSDTGSDVSSGSDAGMGSGRFNDMKNRIVEQARPAIDSMRPAIDSVRPYFSRIQDTSRPYMQSADSYVRQYPWYAVLGGVAVGAMIGMMIARPSNRV